MPLYRVVVNNEMNDRLLVGIRTIGLFGVGVERMKKSLANVKIANAFITPVPFQLPMSTMHYTSRLR